MAGKKPPEKLLQNFLTTGTDVVYLYDGWQCIEEREWNSTTSAWEARRRYIYGGQYIDEPVIFEKDTDANGAVDDATDVSYFYLHDANYNVVATSDVAGDVSERTWYEPYGTATFTDAAGDTPAAASAIDNPYSFQGRRLGSITSGSDTLSIYYYRNRYYSAELGRFVQRDPIGYVDGMNLYAAANSRFFCERDPFGLWMGKWNPLKLAGKGVEWVGNQVKHVPIVGKPVGEVVNAAGHVTQAAGEVAGFDLRSAGLQIGKAGGNVKEVVNDAVSVVKWPGCLAWAKGQSASKLSEMNSKYGNTQINDNKVGHCLFMCYLQKCSGTLSTPLNLLAGGLYEAYHVFTPGHVQGHSATYDRREFPYGFFDGQNPVNWTYDTPGDMIANVYGQLSGSTPVDCESACKCTYWIPGPDYSAGAGNWSSIVPVRLGTGY